MGRPGTAETREMDLWVFSAGGKQTGAYGWPLISPGRSTPIDELGAGALEYVDLVLRKAKSVL